jgi:hypothetical protein
MDYDFFLENKNFFFAIFFSTLSITLLLFKYFAAISGSTKGVMVKVFEYFKSFLTELTQLLSLITDFVKTFHTFFSLLSIVFFLIFDMIKPLILLVLFELKTFVINSSFFKTNFKNFELDANIVQNHWDKDVDLQYLTKFLSYFRIVVSFFLMLSLNTSLTLFLSEVNFTLKPTICWDLLILSYFIEMAGDLHVIFFRNTKVSDPSPSTAAAFYKGFTKFLGLVLGKEASADLTNFGTNFGTKVAENPGISGAAAGAGAVAGAAYEKSKHPIIVEIGKKEINSDSSFLNQTKQYFFDGAIHCDPHSNRMYILLDKHFKGIIKISDLCEKGLISQEKIRERFLTDPTFATAVRNNPHCFQPFGLGDKMIPSEAHAWNEKNKIMHGEQGAKDMGLVVEYIPEDKGIQIPEVSKIGEKFSLNFKKPITIKDLPGFDPKDPSKNLPHISDTSTWFKPKG